jgi:hypothetical protein
MPDVYIDRWIAGPRGQYEAVWVAVKVPAHCPYPTDRYKPETRWAKINENKCVEHQKEVVQCNHGNIAVIMLPRIR